MRVVCLALLCGIHLAWQATPVARADSTVEVIECRIKPYSGLSWKKFDPVYIMSRPKYVRNEIVRVEDEPNWLFLVRGVRFQTGQWVYVLEVLP